MLVTPKISINDGNLVVHVETILTGVPDNIVLTPGSVVGLVAGAHWCFCFGSQKPPGLPHGRCILNCYPFLGCLQLPSFLNWFGWCTWDAFYTDVTTEGVDEGLRSLSEGGTPSFLDQLPCIALEGHKSCIRTCR